MTSKEEKLAAARRKLKEFQGKNKEGDVSRLKTESKQYFYTNNSPTPSSDAENSPHSYQPTATKTPEHWTHERKVSGSSSHSGTTAEFWTENHGPDYSNGIKSEVNESHGGNIALIKSETTKPAEFFSSENSFSDAIKPLQMELQNHAQTIAILVQQRNEAQNALVEVQNLLTAKTGEAEELRQQLMHLSASMNSLGQRLSDAEGVIMKLKLEKEENLQKQDELRTLADGLQAQLTAREEELQELKKKYEEKSSTCQQLLFSLQETQSQLPLYQMQLQQYSAEGNSGLAVQVSELQNENLSLKQKIIELEKKLESERIEKEESSQKFHIYAQQCNSQLSSLNAQLKTLKLENDNFTEENKILYKKVSELESNLDKDPVESYKEEIADLHNQFSALSEDNKKVISDLKQKEEECTLLEEKLNIRDSEISKLLGQIKELEKENQRLSTEAESPKANERLLATIESDKVAAARAVSQNVKLKEQIVELENAFMKLSEEKLELTNQLAHEKHVNGELQNLLKKSEKHQHHHHHHDEECHHEEEKKESLVNDSHEVEELRNIVRQLQDDKMELTARLSAYDSSVVPEKITKESEHDHDEAQCEDTKLLLQQMEEKVKKTMNEIAVLDEEKEKLEHLVLQLQGETETIGEYVTLYQKQRMILKQRSQEKDIQLLQLSRDKEELKSKLASLEELVQRLIAEKGSIRVQPGSGSSLPNPSTPENTANKILALINEIGSTSLIDNQTITFEHCSCCSGRLITI